MVPEQRCLLGVGPVRARDQQCDADGAGRACEAVERLRDVGPHRLALPVRERPVIAAAPGKADRLPGRKLGLRGGADVQRPAFGVAPDLDHFADADPDPRRGERIAVREPDLDFGEAVRARRALGGGATERQVFLAPRCRGFGRRSTTTGSNSRE
jgi:hypothetical protein